VRLAPKTSTLGFGRWTTPCVLFIGFVAFMIFADLIVVEIARAVKTRHATPPCRGD
jgi:hypothetical protein